MKVSLPYANRKLPRVKIAVPFYDSLPETFTMFAENMVYCGIPGYHVVLTKKHSTIIQFARNELMREPEGLEWDYLFFLDDDLGFTHKQLCTRVPVSHPDGRVEEIPLMNALMKRILDNGKLICAGWYCQRGGDHLPLVFDEYRSDGEIMYLHRLDPPKDGLESVGAVATGFLCIHRDVIRAFDRQRDERIVINKRFKAWREQNPDYALPAELRDYIDRCAKPDIRPPFWLDETFDATKQQWQAVGEDVFFCREAKKLGFEIWVDWSCWLGHEMKMFMTPDLYRANNMPDMLKSRDEWWAKERARTKAAEVA